MTAIGAAVLWYGLGLATGLFVLAVYLLIRGGTGEPPWQPDRVRLSKRRRDW